MRARGLVALLMVSLCACSLRGEPAQPPPSEQQAAIEANRAAVTLCESEARDMAESGGDPELAWVVVLAEPPETRPRVVECHYDVDSYPASMPAPTDPTAQDDRTYSRVVIKVVEDGETELVSAVMGRPRPTERPGTRLIRVSPREDG